MSLPIHPDSRPQAEAYDALPYHGRPCPESHPSHLAVLAKLAGLPIPDLRRCRVLELACGDGNNLIAIADSLPESRCLGIDLSPRHIASGQAEIAALGLTNIELRAGDLLQLAPGDPSLGEFDFIIAHCLYSWVPKPVQDRVLALSRRHLAQHGVAFVSYNLLPGWRIVQVLRDFLSFHSRGAADPQDRLQRALAGAALLPLLTDSGHGDLAQFISRYGRDFVERLQRLGPWRDQAVLHDLIGDPCTPVYFSSFLNHAGRFGLRYLADAEFRRGLPSSLSAEAIAGLRPAVETAMDLEQYADFAGMRTFRQSLLTHGESPLRAEPQVADLRGLYVSSAWQASGPIELASDAQAEFRGPDEAVLRTNHPLTKAALCLLAADAPQAPAFSDLCDRAWQQLGGAGSPPSDEVEVLGRTLLRAFLAENRLLRLHAHAPSFPSQPSERPQARRLARRQVLRGDEVTGLFHENVALDALGQALLPLLDGTRDLAALVAAIAAQIESGALDSLRFSSDSDSAAGQAPLADQVTAQLRALARRALLVR
jgi:SAM-dependent methyltransferase/methyltransferase-like protein